MLATRIVFSPERASIESALAHIASRSTKANGASTSAKISSSSACDRSAIAAAYPREARLLPTIGAAVPGEVAEWLKALAC